MHFGTKSYLKNTYNHTAKYALNETIKESVYCSGCWQLQNDSKFI
jgi:hypothetical protein